MKFKARKMHKIITKIVDILISIHSYKQPDDDPKSIKIHSFIVKSNNVPLSNELFVFYCSLNLKQCTVSPTEYQLLRLRCSLFYVTQPSLTMMAALLRA